MTAGEPIILAGKEAIDMLIDVFLDGFVSGVTSAGMSFGHLPEPVAAGAAQQMVAGIQADPLAIEATRQHIFERLLGDTETQRPPFKVANPFYEGDQS